MFVSKFHRSGNPNFRGLTFEERLDKMSPEEQRFELWWQKEQRRRAQPVVKLGTALKGYMSAIRGNARLAENQAEELRIIQRYKKCPIKVR